MKQINLEEILLKNAKGIDKIFPEYVEDCKLAMLEFGKQLLELAAENAEICTDTMGSPYRDWETDRKSTRLNSSHSAKSRMPSSA